MSHGGFGGGGGHSGFGHGGGGHSGFGHGGHGGHSGIGHGGGGHHGTLVGHVLHALGLGQHGHHHGVAGAGHHPDQSPTWNQAMQGEKRPAFWMRVDKRPFMVFFLLVFSSFFWLWIVYNVHHSESSPSNSVAAREPAPAQQAAPAAGYGTEAYAQAQSQAMQNYASQYMSAATANGAAQMYNPAGMAGTGYGSTMATPSAGVSAVSPYGVPAGGYSAYGTASVPTAYGAPEAFSARQPASSYYSYGQLQTGYAPTANGRARLCVSR